MLCLLSKSEIVLKARFTSWAPVLFHCHDTDNFWSPTRMSERQICWSCIISTQRCNNDKISINRNIYTHKRMVGFMCWLLILIWTKACTTNMVVWLFPFSIKPLFWTGNLNFEGRFYPASIHSNNYSNCKRWGGGVWFSLTAFYHVLWPTWLSKGTYTRHLSKLTDPSSLTYWATEHFLEVRENRILFPGLFSCLQAALEQRN